MKIISDVLRDPARVDDPVLYRPKAIELSDGLFYILFAPIGNVVIDEAARPDFLYCLLTRRTGAAEGYIFWVSPPS